MIITIINSISICISAVAGCIIKNEIPEMKERRRVKEHAKDEQQKAYDRSNKSNRKHQSLERAF